MNAQRAADYRGQTQPLFCAKDGQWKEVWPDDEPPFACKIGIHRLGHVEPLVDVARFNREAYTRRNVVERLVGWLKERRRLCTRFEKLANNYLAMVKLEDPRADPDQATLRRRWHVEVQTPA